MFKRRKLRQILTKHQSELLRVKVEKIKGHRSSSKNGKTLVFQDVGDDPQIKFFNYNEIDYNYTKTDEKTDYKNLEIFHRAISPIIILGQFCSLMPVVGVRHHNPRKMRFSFKSGQMMLTLCFLLVSSLLTLTMFKHVSKLGISAKNVVGVVFFGCVQCTCIMFLLLAARWPRLMRLWTKTELVFTRKPYEIPKRNLNTRVRSAAAVIICLSVAEHGLFQASNILSYTRRMAMCTSANATSTVSVDDYLSMNYEFVFQFLPYYKFLGIIILVVNGAGTFVWNYMDLFIMMVSKGIAYRFEQITERINKLADKEVPESIFLEIRVHYVKLCELLECVDENLSGIILLSCMNNLYFVCYQLLNIFNKLRWPINYIYFWYSLLYLIGRTAFVFLTAASINDESRGALSVLRRVSSKTWCVEVERLIFQMTTQTVALSGKKFYFLTRRLLFGMAGTIVTYELVLLQFDEPNRSEGLPELCA